MASAPFCAHVHAGFLPSVAPVRKWHRSESVRKRREIEPLRKGTGANAARRDELLAAFDASYYLRANPEVRERGTDPLTHYLTTGWRTGRDPAGNFDTDYYLRANPDVAASGLNPLVHYVENGRAEGRSPLPPLRELRSLLRSVEALSGVVQMRDPTLQKDALPNFAAAAPQPGRWSEGGDGLVISLGNDDYKLSTGCERAVLQAEEAAFREGGWCYFHVSPVAPGPMILPPGNYPALRLRIDGDTPWLTEAETLLDFLANARRNWARVVVVVHDLRGHNLEIVVGIAKMATGRSFFWIWDHFTICPSRVLLRNGVRFCGAPPLASAACGICIYVDPRTSQDARIRSFFDAVSPIVVAPSEAALNFWREHTQLSHQAELVQEVVTLKRISDPMLPLSPLPRDGGAPQLRIAFLGERAADRGWMTFESLARRFGGTHGYDFLQIGGDADSPDPPIRQWQLRESGGDPASVVDALVGQRVDVVLDWPMWPEVHSFTTMEALAGGCLVITHSRAGMAVRTLRSLAPRQGLVLGSEDELFALLEAGELLKAVEEADRARGEVEIGRGTLGALEVLEVPGQRLVRGT